MEAVVVAVSNASTTKPSSASAYILQRPKKVLRLVRESSRRGWGLLESLIWNVESFCLHLLVPTSMAYRLFPSPATCTKDQSKSHFCNSFGDSINLCFPGPYYRRKEINEFYFSTYTKPFRVHIICLRILYAIHWQHVMYKKEWPYIVEIVWKWPRENALWILFYRIEDIN